MRIVFSRPCSRIRSASHSLKTHLIVRFRNLQPIPARFTRAISMIKPITLSQVNRSPNIMTLYHSKDGISAKSYSLLAITGPTSSKATPGSCGPPCQNLMADELERISCFVNAEIGAKAELQEAMFHQYRLQFQHLVL